MRGKKKTTKEFKEEVFNLVGNEYTVLGEYIAANDKILMRHNKCGYEYKVIPNNFLQGRRCPKCAGCAGKMKKDTEIFKEEVYKLTGDEYTVLGEYIGANDKILMKHNKCGFEYEVAASSFLRGCRCPKCAGNRKKDTNIFKEEVYNKVGDEYTVLGEYIGANKKILIKHNKCGYEYEVKANSFLQNYCRCPKCSNRINFQNKRNRKKDTNIFKEEVFNLVGDEYTVLGEYIGTDTKILMKHNKCGYEYKMTPHNFLQGQRCPKCSRSRKKKDTKLFKKEVYEQVGNEYTVLGEYIGSYTKILMKHNECGHEYKVAPYNFLQGVRCPYCRKNRIKLKLDKDAKIFREKLKEKNDESRKYANNLGQKWSFEDICLLEKYIEEGKNVKEIARLLGRTIASIHQAKIKFLKENEK